MARFCGWSPTITGRIAFSRIAEAPGNHTHIYNGTDRVGVLFGVERRTSRDGPLPTAILRLWRNPDQTIAIFLRVNEADVPQPRSGAAEGELPYELYRDARGELTGELYIFSRSKLAHEQGVTQVLREVGEFAAGARLRTHSQNRTVAARAMADRKTVGQRS